MRLSREIDQGVSTYQIFNFIKKNKEMISKEKYHFIYSCPTLFKKKKKKKKKKKSAIKSVNPINSMANFVKRRTGELRT
jgi:hypothetical protein